MCPPPFSDYFEAFFAAVFLAGAAAGLAATLLVVFALRLRVLPNEAAKIFPRFVRLSPRPIGSPLREKTLFFPHKRSRVPEVERRILNDYYPEIHR